MTDTLTTPKIRSVWRSRSSSWLLKGNLIIVFAVVVVGGMGSLAGAVITGFALGLVEGATKLFYPAASTTVIFLVMILVLLVKPAGLFGREIR